MEVLYAHALFDHFPINFVLYISYSLSKKSYRDKQDRLEYLVDWTSFNQSNKTLYNERLNECLKYLRVCEEVGCAEVEYSSLRDQHYREICKALLYGVT